MPYPIEELRPVGVVQSSLTDLADAPKQVDDRIGIAWLVLSDDYSAGLKGLTPGQDIILLTWLDRGNRAVLSVHPQGNPANPERGVFATRSPNRPNPIGLHRVPVVAIDENRICVRGLDAVTGTPILDIKPVLSPSDA
jgi:tRNA-Thr(GGU) m(6)t(6)A37 methyltransferase TsaA